VFRDGHPVQAAPPYLVIELEKLMTAPPVIEHERQSVAGQPLRRSGGR
jgi:hypothetical protein